MNFMNENIIKKWEESGLLDGLTEMDKDNPMLKIIEPIKHQEINEFPNIESMNKVNESGYNEDPKFGPSEHNPPKLEYQEEYVFDNKGVDISLPGAELSDVDSLKYFFHKYLFSVERGKPNQNVANILKLWIDVIQIKHLTNEQSR